MNVNYDISKYDHSQPSLSFQTESHAITGQSMKLPTLRWGSVSFGFTSLKDMQDIGVWIHEFTEDVIGDLIQGQEGIDVSTFAQIFGHASSFDVNYNGNEFFAVLHHLLTSLSCGTLVPTLDGFEYLEPDEFWRILKPIED